MTSLPLVECSALQPFVGYLRERGCDVERMLASRHVAPEMVARGVGRVTKVQAYGFLEQAALEVGLPDLGFRVGETFYPSKMGAVGRAVLQAPTLAEALRAFANYLKCWVAENDVTLERVGDEVWLRVTTTDGLTLNRGAANQNGVFLLIHIVQLAAGPGWRPLALLGPPGSEELHEGFDALAGVETHIHASDIGIRFPAALLALPLRHVQTDLEDGCRPLEPARGFAAALGQALLDQLPYDGLGSLPVAAEISGMSRRSLQRRLAEEGLTFRRLTERLRFCAARDMLLAEPGSSVRDVASVLGYSGANNFRRAFRRMAGCSPGAYRRARD
jgi:AraC-like DNA-binding protein